MGTWNTINIYTRRRHHIPPIGAVKFRFSAVLSSSRCVLPFLFNTNERNALIRVWRLIGLYCFADIVLKVYEALDVGQVEAIWKHQFSLEHIIGRSQLFLLCKARYLLLIKSPRHEKLLYER